MVVKAHKILLAGAGQLGSRHLQGLAKCITPLSIYVYDISSSSLSLAQSRWLEVVKPNSAHKLILIDSLELIPCRLDLAIVASTAGARPGIIRNVVNRASVRYWVLEKILAQSEFGLDEILNTIGLNENAWVNTPRSMLPWHHQIKSYLDTSHPIKMNVFGEAWGLACNSIHFLELFSFWTEEELVKIDVAGLSSSWIEAKRAGNWEVYGTLIANFSSGSSLTLSARPGRALYAFKLEDASFSWAISEQNGLAQRSDGLKIPGLIPNQSDVTGPLVDSILKSGKCELTSLKKSLDMHRVFIHSLLGHWRLNMDHVASFLPIT
jgi:hypothetical protein